MTGHVHTDLTFVPDLGRAASCAAYGAHRPKPLRFVWHHVLPQICGGLTTPDNLVALCDSDHYAVHGLLWLLAKHGGDRAVWGRLGTPGQRGLAQQGYDLAVAAGTVDRIPDEGAPTVS